MYCKIILLQTSREDAVLLRSRVFEFAFKISVKYPQKQTYKYFNILGLDSYRTMTPKLSQFSKFATKISTFENTQKHMNSGVQISLFHKKKGQKSLEIVPLSSVHRNTQTWEFARKLKVSLKTSCLLGWIHC